jgi:DNA-binding IclR family transcriptional regulator
VSDIQRAGTPLNQSIERAVRLLGFFSPQQPELTLAEMTARLDVNKATAHRYTVALRRVGMLRYDSARGVYTLGPRIVEFAATALAGLRIIDIAAPHMERLVSAVNETCVLSVWDGDAPVVIHVEDSTDRIARVVVRVGARLPLFDSAQGRIFATFSPEAQIARYGDEELEAVRATSVAVSSNVIPGIRALATPVFQDRDLAAAIALVGTSASIPEESDSPMAVQLSACGRTVTAELGFLAREKGA